MNRLLEKDWVLKLLALLLAIGLWLGVHPGGLPLGKRTFTVPLRTAGEGPARTVQGLPRSVRMTVLAPPSVLSSLVRRLEAFVAVGGLGSGKHVLRVRVGAPTGVRVLAVDPPRVEATVKVKFHRLLAVRPVPLEPPPPGLGIRGLTVRPSRVQAYGPADTLAGAWAAARYQPPRRPGSFSRKVRLWPENAAGKILAGVTLPETEATVSGTAYLLPAVYLPVVAVTEGRPAAGFTVTGLGVRPERLAVRPEDSNLPKTLVTAPVFLDGRSRDFSTSARVLLPRGVRPLGTAVVTVTVRIAHLAGP